MLTHSAAWIFQPRDLRGRNPQSLRDKTTGGFAGFGRPGKNIGIRPRPSAVKQIFLPQTHADIRRRQLNADAFRCMDFSAPRPAGPRTAIAYAMEHQP
jgi:hypothetical protein